MKILVDMNLAPLWVDWLEEAGIKAIHWADVGAATAPDSEIMAWARQRDFVVFTHDLDFGALLAASQASGPSVLQVRARHVLPEGMGRIVLSALRQFGDQLAKGALITVNADTSRVRILPLRRAEG